MGNTVRHFVCWCLMLVLPLQALAGMIRLHDPHSDCHPVHAAHAATHAAQRMLADSEHPMAAASLGPETGGSASTETACAHHAAPTCSACQSSSNESSDLSNLPPSCSTCTLCCLLLIPAPFALVPPAGTNSSPPDSDVRFRSVAPHTLERPPRSFFAA